MKRVLAKTSILLLTATLFLFASAPVFAQANMQVTFGVGFDDATPAVPIGGNNGTTVGDQRKVVLQAAAAVWGAALTSGQTITISASFTALPCSATSGTLGSAGPTARFANFGFGAANRWYPVALAEALSNTN